MENLIMSNSELFEPLEIISQLPDEHKILLSQLIGNFLRGSDALKKTINEQKLRRLFDLDMVLMQAIIPQTKELTDDEINDSRNTTVFGFIDRHTNAS